MINKKEDIYNNVSIGTNNDFGDNQNNTNYYGYSPQQIDSNPMNYEPLPYMPYNNPKKNKKKNTVIILSCVAIFLALVIAFFGFVFIDNSEKYIEKYEQTKELSDLYYLCNYYDNHIYIIDDTLKAQEYFEIALSDTKTFLRTYKPDAYAGQYQSEDDAYYYFASDYLYLLIKNGEYDKFVSEFTFRMLEIDATDTYYFDSYGIVDGAENGDLPAFTEDEKRVVIRGFENLIGACRDDDEKYINLQEYYYCCETFEYYDEADRIEEMINKLDNKSNFV